MQCFSVAISIFLPTQLPASVQVSSESMKSNVCLVVIGTLGILSLTAKISVAFSPPPVAPTSTRKLQRIINGDAVSRIHSDDRRAGSHLLGVISSNDDSNDTGRGRRLRRWRKQLDRFGKSMLLASTILASASRQAEAKYAHEIGEERIYSIRPGMSDEQASKLVEGELPDDMPKAGSALDTTGSLLESDQKKTSKISSSIDYGDEDGEEDDFMDFEKVGSSTTDRKSFQAQQLVADRLQSAGRSQFSGIDPSKTKTRGLYVKVSVALFIPTWGAMGVREFVRRRKEEAYVQKGLKILAAQRAEYFNITETTADSDIEDELKDLKDDSEDDDEDDSDDDEDDDDDDDEPDVPRLPSRKGPKKPSGGGGTSGSDDDLGYGKPSDDDLKRLGDLFNKS